MGAEPFLHPGILAVAKELSISPGASVRKRKLYGKIAKNISIKNISIKIFILKILLLLSSLFLTFSFPSSLFTGFTQEVYLSSSFYQQQLPEFLKMHY